MVSIYIDADACSVKDETYKVALRYQWPVRVVANQSLHTPDSSLIVPMLGTDHLRKQIDIRIAELHDGGPTQFGVCVMKGAVNLRNIVF